MTTKYRVHIRNPELLIEEIEVTKENEKLVWFKSKGDSEPIPFAKVSQYHEIFNKKIDAYARLVDIAEKKLKHAKEERDRASKLLKKIQKMPMR